MTATAQSQKAQITELLNYVPDSAFPSLLEVVKRFIDEDDIATPEDIAAHEKAVKEYQAGEAIPFCQINWK